MKRYTSIDMFDPKKLQNWFVVANRIEATIYSEEKDHQFHFINRLLNPNGSLLESELDSDKPGTGLSSSGAGTIHHSLDHHFHKHEQTAIRFAIRIGKFLSVAAKKNLFKEITIVAEPHFLGLLREHLPANVLQKKVRSLDREYAQGSMQEIRKQILDALSFH